MSLMKCSECGKDISDKGSSCPNCGSPIRTRVASVVQIENVPGQNLHVEPELTSKKWKKVKLLAGLIIFLSFVFGPILGGRNGPYAGFAAIFIPGLILWIISKIGAWYADKRTR